MKIYFGHSRMTYGTPEERKAIFIIADYYPNCDIINPNTPLHQNGCSEYAGDESAPGKEMKYFLDLTDDCDVGCFYQFYPGKWSAGTACETNYMIGAGKSVFQIDLKQNLLIPIRKRVEALSFDETYDLLVKSGKRVGELR